MSLEETIRACQAIVTELDDEVLRQAVREVFAWETAYATPQDGGQLLCIGRLFASKAGVSSDFDNYSEAIQIRMPDWRRMICVRWAEERVVQEAARRFARQAE